jgi:hypothetical protein
MIIFFFHLFERKQLDIYGKYYLLFKIIFEDFFFLGMFVDWLLRCLEHVLVYISLDELIYLKGELDNKKFSYSDFRFSCFELTPAFNILTKRPPKLYLLPNETYPSIREVC